MFLGQSSPKFDQGDRGGGGGKGKKSINIIIIRSDKIIILGNGNHEYYNIITKTGSVCCINYLDVFLLLAIFDGCLQ